MTSRYCGQTQRDVVGSSKCSQEGEKLCLPWSSVELSRQRKSNSSHGKNAIGRKQVCSGLFSFPHNTDYLLALHGNLLPMPAWPENHVGNLHSPSYPPLPIFQSHPWPCSRILAGTPPPLLSLGTPPNFIADKAFHLPVNTFSSPPCSSVSAHNT